MKMVVAWICVIAVFLGAYMIALKLDPPPKEVDDSNLVINSAAVAMTS